MKLSEHGKQRMKERAGLNHRERIRMFSEAVHKGKSPNDVSIKKNKELKEYLSSKGNCKVKLYKGYVFIYSKNSQRLYTMYKLPERLGEVNESSNDYRDF